MIGVIRTADKQAQGGTKAESNCFDACAKAWPRLLTEEKPSAAGEPVRKSLVGTIKRNGGSTQVTYNGWPLYHFVKDKGKHKAHRSRRARFLAANGIWCNRREPGYRKNKYGSRRSAAALS